MGVGAGLYMYVVVVQKFTFAISSPDEFLLHLLKLNYLRIILYHHQSHYRSHVCYATYCSCNILIDAILSRDKVAQ